MASTRFGFVTFEGMGYETPIRKADEFGFDFVEMMFPYVASDADVLGREYVTENAEDIRRTLADHGIDPVVHLPHHVDIGANSEIVRSAGIAELEACLQAAAEIGAEKAVFHPATGTPRRVWTDAAIRDRVVESVAEIDAVGRELGVEPCMENVVGSAFPVDAFEEFFERTDCAMTLDTGHARVSGLDDDELAAFAAENADRIGHVHLNDNKRFVTARGDPPADDHVPTGSGDLDGGALLSALDGAGWDGTVSLEIQTRNFEYVEFALRQVEAAR